MARNKNLAKLLLPLVVGVLCGCAGIVSQNTSGNTTVMPAIATQPTNQTVTAGQSANFSVVASGTAPLTFQWRKNSTNIGGATAASYTTPATTTSDNGSTFDVVVSNAKGGVTSGAALLTVNTSAVAPAITTQPVNQSVTAGQTANFTVAATGTAPLSYQWQKNGTAIAGATSSTYVTPATTTADSGATFNVVVSNSKGSVASGPATLTVSAATVVPAISTQPTNQTVTAGQTATFSVAATGTAPLTYQWKKNGASISGATASTYTTPATTTADNGSTFNVMVSNSAGSATSGPATLTVSAAAVAPAITTQPVNRTVTAGQSATFSVAATGTAPLGYQWQKNGSAIAGATSSTYTTPVTTTADNGAIFKVVITNAAGSATSNSATLTVNAAVVAPTIATQPASQTVTAGQTATFSVAANGTAPLTYQWKKNGANISGATASSYTTPATSTADNGATFAVVVSNSAGSATSGSATLTVNPATVVAPTITTEPASVTVVAGQTATFTVAANGTAPLTYQWQKNSANISGATGSTYTTPATVTSDSGSTFTAVVSNSAGNATSNVAVLTVNAGTQKTYSTTFPLTEGAISEGGNWINGGLLGIDWANIQTTTGLAFGTENGLINYNDSTAVLTGTWNTNQMAQATVHTVNQNGNIFEEVELRLRTAIIANTITGYEFNFRCTSDGTQYAQIVRWNGPLGSFTLLDSRSGPGLHDGDVVKATAKGNVLTIYLNGTALYSVTDGTFTNGSPGIGFYNQNGTTANNHDYGFTSFSAADNI